VISAEKLELRRYFNSQLRIKGDTLIIFWTNWICRGRPHRLLSVISSTRHVLPMWAQVSNRRCPFWISSSCSH